MSSNAVDGVSAGVAAGVAAGEADSDGEAPFVVPLEGLVAGPK